MRVWLSIFAIYRYVLTLEMLAPLLIALALSLWPLSERRRLGALGASGWSRCSAPAGVRSVRSGGVRRDVYVDVTVPPIADPASHAGRDGRYRADGLHRAGVSAADSVPAHRRLARLADRRIRRSAIGCARASTRTTGRSSACSSNDERERAVAAFAADGLMLANTDCATIRSNIGEPLLWCALTREAVAR